MELILAGPGSYARMKTAMQAHVDQERHVMFQQSADEARRRLIEMIDQASMTMSDRMDEVFVAMRRDYRAVLGGGDAQGEILPKSQRLLRKQVMTTLDGVERQFEKALGLAAAADDNGNAEGEAKNLEERGEDQGSDADDAPFRESATNDMVNRQLKSEDKQHKDIPMDDIPGPASLTKDNEVAIQDIPQLPNNHVPVSADHDKVKTESIAEHTEDAPVDRSALGQPEPHEQGTFDSYQESFNSTGIHEADQGETFNSTAGTDEDNAEEGENLPSEPEHEPEFEEEMDSFESFPHSDF